MLNCRAGNGLPKLALQHALACISCFAASQWLICSLTNCLQDAAGWAAHAAGLTATWHLSRHQRLLASQGEQQGLVEAFQAQLQEAAADADQQRQHWEAALAHAQVPAAKSRLLRMQRCPTSPVSLYGRHPCLPVRENKSAYPVRRQAAVNPSTVPTLIEPLNGRLDCRHTIVGVACRRTYRRQRQGN